MDTPITINDRLLLAETLKNRGLIQSGDDHYKQILDNTVSTDDQIREAMEYHKVKRKV